MRTAGRLAALLALIAWLPLLSLTLVDGTAYSGVTVSFFGDYLPHGRYLVALPLLVFLHPVVDRRIAAAIATLEASGLFTSADQASLQRLLDRARSLWRNRTLRLSLVVAGLLAAFLALPARSLITVSDWRFAAEPDAGIFSGAGWWSFIVSSVLIRILQLAALWKLALWSWFQWRLSRLPLNYQPMHPDRCGGISFLDRVPVGFSLLAAALGVQFGCVIANAVTYQGHDLMSYKTLAAAFIALVIILLFAPLLAFAGPLAAARSRSETAFRAWVAPAAGQVGISLRQTGSDSVAAQLSSQHISTLADSAALFQGIAQMRKVPIGAGALRTVLATTVLATSLPLLPLLPLKEIVIGLTGIVF